jgi:hypothetical protein
VRDGIEMAKRGKPTVALVTDEFWAQGDFVATAAGMPDIPRHQLPHPVAGSGKDAMSTLAEEIAEQLIARLRNQPVAA